MAIPSSQRLSVRRRWRSWLRITAFFAVGCFVLAWAPAFGPVIFPLLMTLAMAWFLWRSEYESGRD